MPYGLTQASIAVIYRGSYTLIPVVNSRSQAFIELEDVRRIITALPSTPEKQPPSDLDLLLVQSSRAAQATIRAKANQEARSALEALGFAPIVINWDHREARLPLAAIRQGQRGIGDHALTLFFTEESTVFDQSHIFFDGTWGVALAEIMTGEALSWAVYLAHLPPAVPARSTAAQLTLRASPDVYAAAERASIPAEAYAENTTLRLNSVLTLRRLLKARSDLVNVTVNDLLILYRAIHGRRYRPSPPLLEQLERLQATASRRAHEAYILITEALEKVQHNNPAILIPMDASQTAPHERLYPTTFRNPMVDLLDRHDATLAALHDYKNASANRDEAYAAFDEQQRYYLRMIASFGILMKKYKDIALSGQSTSTMAIKMLAHMPDAIQRLLDQIPGRFDVLNEIIKGEEVFSNVGRVAKGSTLRRFITAKDDNHQKALAWGVLTDDQDIVHISLRDFRPHVTILRELKMDALANLIAQDLLDSYVDGFNLFIRELRDITLASRETKFYKASPKEDIEH